MAGRSKAPAFLIIGCCCATLVGCSGKSELQRSVDRLRRTMDEVRSFQAEQTSEISAVQQRVRELAGRIEEIEHRQATRLGGDIKSLQEDLSDLSRRVPPPELVPEALLVADEGLAERMPSAVGPIFLKALQRIRRGQYRQALPTLREAFDANFGADGTAEIMFWRALCHEGLEENRLALAALNELISAYPNHDRVPAALLRQADMFLGLGDSKIAKLTLQKLLGDFPNSEQAVQAKERLKGLK